MIEEKDKWRLTHILEAIEDLEELTSSYDQKKFINDYKLQLAVIRLFEIIGEAASNISSGLKSNRNEVNWREAVDMRNKMIHNYFEVRVEIVWDTIQNDVPILKKHVEQILNN